MAALQSQQLYQAIEKSLAEQKFEAIYFFHGDEPYLVQQAAQYVKVCALHGSAADFNFTSYYAADADITDVRNEIETLPMMATRRVVIIKEIQDLKDSEWQELEPILLEPVESTVLILLGSKLDKRKKYFKILSEKAVQTEFRKPFENQIPGWIRQICRAHNLQINDDAVQLLHRLVGSPLLEIESEVKKLADFLGARPDSPKEASLNDVAECVSKRREDSVFALAAKIAQGDRHQALLQLANLLEHGQSEIGIVALVARHIRILLMLKQGAGMGLSGQKLSSHAQVPNYYLNEYLDQARLWTPKKLETILLILAETDRALKSSPLSAHIWLENLIFRACALLQDPYVLAETNVRISRL